MNLQRMIHELRAGRVLSAANEGKLRQAVEALQAVLEQLGIDEENSRGDGPSLERRFAPIDGLEVRAEADKPPVIMGHAALFDTKSVFLYGFRETIEPGAFAASVKSGDIRACDTFADGSR